MDNFPSKQRKLHHGYEYKNGSKTGAPQAFREMTEKGTTQAKETYEKMSVASTEAADLIQNSYLTAVKRVQDYNNKFFEFANENTNAAFDFIQKLPLILFRRCPA